MDQRRPPGKSKKRGLIWVVFLLIVAGCGLRGLARRPAEHHPRGKAAGRRWRSGGRGAALGPVPVVVTKVARSSIPVYLNGWET